MTTKTEEDNEDKKDKILRGSKIYKITSSKNVSKFSFYNLAGKAVKRHKTRIENKFRLNKEEMELELKRMKKMLRHTTAYDLCINALSYKSSERTVELNKTISYYLKNLKNFMNIFSNEEEEDLEKIITEISSHLKYEKFIKNNVICKYGDKADKFYIILRGKVIFLVPKMHKHYLSEEEYLEYLIRLRKKGENELVANLISKNQLIFYLGDDFDTFVLNCLERNEKNKEKLYSERTYKLLYDFKSFLEKENEKVKINNNRAIKEMINIEEYIKTTTLYTYDNPNYAKLNKKKLITTFEYETTNIFEDGDTFGSVGTNSKSNKRTATSICYEDCHLGVLEKDDYINILEKVNAKARNGLYDLVFENKIFIKLSKYTFINKYIHMFHFIKFYKNDYIMNDSNKFNKLILLYKGEFILSINKNLIELNELITRVKKIRGKLMGLSEDLIKKDLKEIKENKSLLLAIKYSSKNIANLITKKQNYIIAKVKTNLVLGFPNTIDPETNLPFFNCQCASSYANGYKVESEMLSLIEKDGFLRRKTPEIAINHITIYLKRLLELKNLIMKKINNPGNYIGEENAKIQEVKNRNLENLEIKKNMEDNNCKVERNSSPKKNKTSSILFDFNQKIVAPTRIDKSLIRNKTKSLSPIRKKLQTINDLKEPNTDLSVKNFFSMILKFKKNASQKRKLLNKVQRQSHKFIIKEKIELKQIQMNLNKLKTKDEYNDFSTLFSKNPKTKKTYLDQLREKKNEDNVLDPIINNMKKQLKNEKTHAHPHHTLRNNIELKNKSYESLDKLFNTIINNTNLKIDNNSQTETKYLKTASETKNIKLNNLKMKNQFPISNKFKDFDSFYNNTDFNKNKKSENKYNLTKINLNDIDISKTNNNYYNNTINVSDNAQDIYYMLYLKYIKDELKNKNLKNFKTLSNDRFKTLNTDNNFMKTILNQNKKEGLIMPNIRNITNNNNL